MCLAWRVPEMSHPCRSFSPARRFSVFPDPFSVSPKAWCFLACFAPCWVCPCLARPPNHRVHGKPSTWTIVSLARHVTGTPCRCFSGMTSTYHASSVAFRVSDMQGSGMPSLWHGVSVAFWLSHAGSLECQVFDMPCVGTPALQLVGSLDTIQSTTCTYQSCGRLYASWILIWRHCGYRVLITVFSQWSHFSIQTTSSSRST